MYKRQLFFWPYYGLPERIFQLADLRYLVGHLYSPVPKFIDDGTVAIAMTLPLFFIPARGHQTIMDWETASQLPWGIVLLFGGGFALAAGFKQSGLSAWFGEQLQGLSSLHPILIMIAISLLMVILTQFTSNTASTQMILPIVASMSISIKTNPLPLMILATLSASCAFMLPVSTPPNAIIFGSSAIKAVSYTHLTLPTNREV